MPLVMTHVTDLVRAPVMTHPMSVHACCAAGVRVSPLRPVLLLLRVNMLTLAQDETALHRNSADWLIYDLVDRAARPLVL